VPKSEDNKTISDTSDGIACRMLIQNKQLEQMDMFPYIGSLITEDGECTTEFRTRLNGGQATACAQHTVFNEDATNESANVACSNVRKLETQKE